MTAYELYAAFGLPALGLAVAGLLYVLFGRPLTGSDKLRPPAP